MKPVLVEAFRAKLPVKAFYVAVLHGLARIRKNVFHLVIVSPGIHNIAGKFRAVIGQNLFRKPPEQGNSVQNSRHPPPGERTIHFKSQTLPRHFINYGQNTNV
ncbi:hypothetical protein SDC9_192438 [bioreactor metagenome]|uniref:Uncharacterized protein n=1 Tax=bioreactor metagenome TaxID=1076179 RepID=A0A645I0Q3_9ZZZZ